MTLQKLIQLLEAAPQGKIVPKGFTSPHSWRGVYAELAFEPAENVKVSEMLADAKSALGKTFEGYKGGDFTMDENTEVHIADYGSGEDLIGEILMFYMLNSTP